MKVVCFGDSNTYGYDPRSYIGGRYDAEHRWVELLAAKTGWDIRNEGMNGREIPTSPILISPDTDLEIVMLGTNDLLQGDPVRTVVRKMERFLHRADRTKLLLIGPPPMVLGEWVATQALIDASKALNIEYSALAQRLGIKFANAGEWGIALTFDGVHFTEAGHRAFAENVYQCLNELHLQEPNNRR